MKKLLIFIFLIDTVNAQKLDFERLSDQFGRKHISTLVSYLSIPCDANFTEDIARNYVWVEKQFSERGFQAQRIESPTLPLLLLEKKSKNASAKTIMFYYHSDGQPVIKSQWFQVDPFVPVLKEYDTISKTWKEISFEKLKGEINPEWRIFGRASSDDKGPGVMMIAALDALESQKINIDYNLKILVDFEEEKGSVSLPSIIDKNKDLLNSDFLLIFDGPAHNSNLPTLTFGARGILTFTLTTYGPIRPLHSGHYGNYVPNPAFRMAKLLAGMKDEEGKVVIPGFYDGIKPSTKVLKEIAGVPDDLVELNNTLGIKTAEKVGTNYQQSLLYPSLNIRGMKSADVGSLAATIIPDVAIAEIDVRTVRASNPDNLLTNVKKYIISKGYTLLDHDPSFEERMKFDKICKFTTKPAYGAFSTDMADGKWIEEALEISMKKKIVKLPTMGGSVPISPFVNKLGVKAIIVPTVNADNNQHSANENLRLGNYFEGIKMMMAILQTKI